MPFFMSEFPIHFIKQYIYVKEALINTDNSKKTTKSSKPYNSKKITYNTFFLTNLSNGNFLYCPKFFILTKTFCTVHTPTKMKQNLLHWSLFVKIFINFLKFRRVWSFSRLSKINFFHNDWEWAEKTILECCFTGGS